MVRKLPLLFALILTAGIAAQQGLADDDDEFAVSALAGREQ